MTQLIPFSMQTEEGRLSKVIANVRIVYLDSEQRGRRLHNPVTVVLVVAVIRTSNQCL